MPAASASLTLAACTTLALRLGAGPRGAGGMGGITRRSVGSSALVCDGDGAVDSDGADDAAVEELEAAAVMVAVATAAATGFD